MADYQFAGRGQSEAKWHAEPGLNLTASLYLNIGFLSIEKQYIFNKAISLAILKAIQRIAGERVTIKWPNDIYFYDQKIAGILIENILQGHTIKATVVGFGINVNQQSFPGALNKSATSLSKILQQDVDLQIVLKAVCEEIETHFLKLREGRYKTISSEYLSNLYRLRQVGLYRSAGAVFEGEIVDVSDTGKLVILVDGLEKHFAFKEVDFLLPGTR